MKNSFKLTDPDILLLALSQLDKYYDDLDSACRSFKHICHDHLPQSGDGYVANKNVFDIQDKALADIAQAKADGRKTILKLINKL